MNSKERLKTIEGGAVGVVVVALALLAEQVVIAPIVFMVGLLALAIIYYRYIDTFITQAGKKKDRYRRRLAKDETDIKEDLLDPFASELRLVSAGFLLLLSGIFMKYLFLSYGELFLIVGIFAAIVSTRFLRSKLSKHKLALNLNPLYYRQIIIGLIALLLVVLPDYDFVQIRYLGQVEWEEHVEINKVVEKRPRPQKHAKKVDEGGLSKERNKRRFFPQEPKREKKSYSRSERKAYLESNSPLEFEDYYFVYKKKGGSDVAYCMNKMHTFYTYESMALDYYYSSFSYEGKIDEIEMRGLYYYEEMLLILSDISKRDVPQEIEDHNMLLQVYCQLRIDVYKAMLEELKENGDDSNSEIKDMHRRIDDLVEVINMM